MEKKRSKNKRRKFALQRRRQNVKIISNNNQTLHDQIAFLYHFFRITIFFGVTGLFSLQGMIKFEFFVVYPTVFGRTPVKS